MSLRSRLSQMIATLLKSRPTRRTAVGVAAASLTTMVVSTAEAQAPHPARPHGTAAKDTVHRYQEKFVLTPSDSVVIRADTVWYPRSAGKAIPLTAPSSGSQPTAPAPRSSGGGGGGHQSHVSHASHSSHSSHRSMVGYRSGY